MSTPFGMDPTGKIPYNEEHTAARQADVTARKAEWRAQATPEEVKQHDVIETVVRMLEEAKIPFWLYADSVPYARSTEGCFWWQYNKLGYEADWDEMHRSSVPRGMNLITREMMDMSARMRGTFVYITPEGLPGLVAKAGEVSRVGPVREGK